MTPYTMKWTHPVGENKAAFAVEVDGQGSLEVTLPVLKKDPKAPTRAGIRAVEAEVAEMAASHA